MLNFSGLIHFPLQQQLSIRNFFYFALHRQYKTDISQTPKLIRFKEEIFFLSHFQPYGIVWFRLGFVMVAYPLQNDSSPQTMVKAR